MLLDIIDPYLLLGIGVVLIGLEAIITSFILIWFGLGFLIVALISMGYEFSDGIWQLGAVAIISLVFIVLLRKKVLEKFLSSDENITDNFLEEGGIGEIKNSKVFFKGTYWEIDSSLNNNEFEENEKVTVIKTYKNSAKIEKK
ncbi:NfeD family protein [Arcobacter sp. LA11]|uniref:NfeD family protein n=1 Tax=Arcobacter sp. LA11 TaxID=1898176 RepID=UPI0009332099|nr:nodulation efficiency protein D [Arcobacter sp. LA11]